MSRPSSGDYKKVGIKPEQELTEKRRRLLAEFKASRFVILTNQSSNRTLGDPDKGLLKPENKIIKVHAILMPFSTLIVNLIESDLGWVEERTDGCELI